MPLPLIPLIVAGGLAVSATIASKKGYDSYQNVKETKDVAQKVESRYRHAFDQFDTAKDATNIGFEEYGAFKLQVFDTSMKQFVEAFQQLKNLDFTDTTVQDFLSDYEDLEEFILHIKKQVVQAEHILGVGIASIAGGGLAALGAVGAATTFGAASTGTSIALLSGIAAKNATLAFLGGGALSVGGLGMAGGMAVLGGIAIAPALAIGSLIFATTTENKLEEMYTKKAEVDAEISKLEAAEIVLQEVHETTLLIHQLAEDVNSLFMRKVDALGEIIKSNGVDYSRYTKDGQQIVFQSYQLAGLIKGIFNQSLLTEDGALAPNITEFIQMTNHNLAQLKE